MCIKTLIMKYRIKKQYLDEYEEARYLPQISWFGIFWFHFKWSNDQNRSFATIDLAQKFIIDHVNTEKAKKEKRKVFYFPFNPD